MHEYFKNIFVTSDGKHPLHYSGTEEQGQWLHGYVQTNDGEHRFPVVDKIPHFIPDGVGPWATW